MRAVDAAGAAIERPLLRGYFHVAAAIAAPAGIVALLLRAHSPASYVGAAIFGAGLLGLFSFSAIYHVVAWRTRLHSLAERADHAMIFVAVAASYSPFCLQVVGWAAGVPLLAGVWTLALAGAGIKQFCIGAPPWLGFIGYAALGWVGLAALPWLTAALGGLELGALFVAGGLFTVGGVAYATHRPNPFPRILGHHEVFHILVTLGFGVIYTVVFTSVLPR